MRNDSFNVTTQKRRTTYILDLPYVTSTFKFLRSYFQRHYNYYENFKIATLTLCTFL